MRLFVVALGVALAGVGSAMGQGLSIVSGPAGKPYLAYDGAPLFAFGPGDEARLLSGGADVARWASWQRAHGMNLLRGYPASVPIDAWSPSGLHPFVRAGEKWDVDGWNDAYFDHLGGVAAYLEGEGIVLHLQLWQIVWFKAGAARWDANYLNRRNNVNEWTGALGRGRDYIDAPAGSRARGHQREWVERVLGAVKGRGNVIIDVINELGNEMGTLEWAVEVAGWIRAFEAAHGVQFIVGVDSEHHYREEVFAPHREAFDLIILNELRSPGHARGAMGAFGMPVVTVRPSDGRNRYEDYMFARADQVGEEHQTRYRTLCYRSMFAGVQSVGAYWKMTIDESDYRDMEHWPVYAEGVRTFWEMIAGEWPSLESDDGFIVGEPVTPHAYGLRSAGLYGVYLECGSHTWGNAYEASELRIVCDFGRPRVEIFDPRSGGVSTREAVREGGELRITLPAFTDDLAVLVWSDGDAQGLPRGGAG